MLTAWTRSARTCPGHGCMRFGGGVSVDGCLGPGSHALSSATFRGRGYPTRIRINASRHDSRQEPYAVVPHVRICAGGGEQSPSLPRPEYVDDRIVNDDAVNSEVAITNGWMPESEAELPYWGSGLDPNGVEDLNEELEGLVVVEQDPDRAFYGTQVEVRPLSGWLALDADSSESGGWILSWRNCAGRT